MNIKDRFDNYFKTKGVTQREIAKTINFSESMTGRYLKRPNLNFITALTKSYPDIDWNFILKDDYKSKNNDVEYLLDAIESLTKQLRSTNLD